MIYPKFINNNSLIGVTAPSDGVVNPLKVNRLNNAIKSFEALGFKVVETPDVRTSFKGRSTDSKTQAEELLSLYNKPDVDMIYCVRGGEFLVEILAFLDFDVMKNNPKWLQGYSDSTGLLYTLTTALDIATVYADNFVAFGMSPWHKSLENNLSILKGEFLVQESFDKYEEDIPYVTGLEPYNLVNNSLWEALNGEDEISVEGRIIGGCIDCIDSFIGTKYDKTRVFLEKYKSDGIIWYFDNCELSSEALIRCLWRMKELGYFKYVKAFIWGRCIHKSYYDIDFKEALKHSLNEYNVPVIINADIGHIAPRMTIINGSIAKVNYKDGKGSIECILK